MDKPETVVFDLGKVLVDFDYDIAIRRFAEQSDVSLEAIRQLVATSPLQNEFEKGRISTEEFFEAVNQGAGFRGSLEDFVEIFADIFSPMELMIGFHGELIRKGIPTCVFSNTNEIATRHIRERFPFFSRFDQFVLSHEHGAMKPEAALYEVVEEQTGRAGGELLYIDDLPENVETGRVRGWQVIQQKNEQFTITQAKHLLGW